MKINELHNQPVQADTYEASMALNQLLKIGKHAIKLHNLIKDDAEMEAWVAKKIDLAGDYVKSVHGYMQGENNNLYDDGGLTEDAPFGSGFDLLRMAIMKKFISVQEWDLLKDKWKGAATEIEQRYDDWPEGEGFGSSDHNFAIKELMELVGYEFDDKDTSGRFVVTKQPVEIEKAGIKNARMKDAMPTEDGSSYTSMNKYGLSAREHKGKFYSYKHGKLTGAFDSMKELAKHQEELIKDESVSEDAGEGHMSKSTLYTTAKYAIELASMIKKGDDLEGWVQSKLNKAADYLIGAYNYEEYQKLNPYREEIDSQTFAKHSEIVKKNIDEILSKETKLDDIDTKPGMMRILNKRVQEFEKKMAKEARTDEYADTKPRDMAHYRELMKALQDLERDEKVMTDPKAKAEVQRRKLQLMKDKPTNEDKYNFRGNPFPVLGKAQSYLGYGAELAKAVIDKDPSAKVKAETYLDRVPSFINTEMKEIMPTNESGIMYRAGVKKYGKAGMKAIQSAAGKGANHQEIGKIKDRYLKDEELDEGLKDWARNLTAAGIIVGAVAGLGSINNAIDNSVPAVKAMNTALEMAKEKGDTELAKAIEKDLKDAKIRLDIGKDLNHVTYLQDKYSKFMPTEGLAYESKLAIELNKRLK